MSNSSKSVRDVRLVQLFSITLHKFYKQVCIKLEKVIELGWTSRTSLAVCPMAYDDCDRYDGWEPSKQCLTIDHKNCNLFKKEILKLGALQRNILRTHLKMEGS